VYKPYVIDSVLDKTYQSIMSIANYLLNYTKQTINLLKPNDPYMGRTAPLTSESCILCIYSTNIGTEYFKHAL